MSEEASILIRISDPEAVKLIRSLAETDCRSLPREVEWLARQELSRRLSTPNCITVTEAEQIAAKVEA